MALAIGGSAAVKPIRRELTISTNGQTVFVLPTMPSTGAAVFLVVNGQECGGPTNITVSGTTVTWINPDYKLAITDTLEAIY